MVRHTGVVFEVDGLGVLDVLKVQFVESLLLLVDHVAVCEVMSEVIVARYKNFLNLQEARIKSITAITSVDRLATFQ